jgi:ATP-dependent DNA ligase
MGKQSRAKKRKQRAAYKNLLGAAQPGQQPSSMGEIKGMMQRAASNTMRRLKSARERGEITGVEQGRLMEILHDSFKIEPPHVYIPEMTDEDIRRNVVLMREAGDV